MKWRLGLRMCNERQQEKYCPEKGEDCILKVSCLRPGFLLLFLVVR